MVCWCNKVCGRWINVVGNVFVSMFCLVIVCIVWLVMCYVRFSGN